MSIVLERINIWFLLETILDYCSVKFLSKNLIKTNFTPIREKQLLQISSPRKSIHSNTSPIIERPVMTFWRLRLNLKTKQVATYKVKTSLFYIFLLGIILSIRINEVRTFYFMSCRHYCTFVIFYNPVAYQDQIL